MNILKERNIKLCLLLGTTLFSLYSVWYLYYKYEYFEERLFQIVLSGFIILSFFQLSVILLTKYILKMNNWRLFHFKSTFHFTTIFSILFLIQLYRYSMSLAIICTYGLKYIFLFLFPGTIIFCLIYKFFPD